MNNNGPAGKAYGTKVSVFPQDKMPALGQLANGHVPDDHHCAELGPKKLPCMSTSGIYASVNWTSR